MLKSMVRKCCNCEVDVTIFGDMENCPRCGESLDPKFIAFNKRAEIFLKETIMLAGLAKSATGTHKGVLHINALAAWGEFLNLLRTHLEK